MLKRLETILLELGALAVMLMGAMITVNVILRLFGTSLPDSVILVREFMVAAIVLPLAAVTAARAHVCVEVLVNRLSLRTRHSLIILGWVVGLVAITPLVYAGGRELVSTWTRDAFFFGDLSLPKWPGRFLFFIGMALCWVRLWAILIEDIKNFSNYKGS